MAEQDPFSKAGKWKVPSRTPDSAPDVTRPMPAAAPADDVTRPRPVPPPADEETRIRPAQSPADDVTRIRPPEPAADDVTRAAPVLPPGEITRVEAQHQAPAEELMQVDEPADQMPSPAPGEPRRTLGWPLLAGALALIAAAGYFILGR
jgi:hypothetical protein